MNNAIGFLGLQLLSFWPVWRWYAERMTDGSDEPSGILALVAAIAIGVFRGHWRLPPASAIQAATGLVALYGLLYAWLPFLGRAVLCMLALALVLSPVLYGRRFQPGMTGLLILSLPLIASLQFYGGFPVRYLTAHLAAWMLQGFGYPVTVEGTLMHWLGEVVVVDAPCAGIKMLWSGLLVNFCLAAWFDANLFKSWMATSLTLTSVFFGNVFRATALFFVESGIFEAPDWAHQGIGMLVFLFVTLSILGIHSRIHGGSAQCAR
ncbi:MAG: archaeosortase/exosortase family protein [Gammaproteobacteria bacterium]